ncbi:hypothetical protein AERO9AM_30619 [Aeromicrobium sp. 9AM]|nr:hypothetical protein AERO9AM_30619 [Aeromicrobium sp. 9AM]
MTRDDGWDDSELDAFALGAADEKGMRRDGDVGERARRGLKAAANHTREVLRRKPENAGDGDSVALRAIPDFRLVGRSMEENA